MKTMMIIAVTQNLGSYEIKIQKKIAQLVEHCTGITEVMGSNPVQG